MKRKEIIGNGVASVDAEIRDLGTNFTCPEKRLYPSFLSSLDRSIGRETEMAAVQSVRKSAHARCFPARPLSVH